MRSAPGADTSAASTPTGVSPALELAGVSKRFGGLRALDDVSFTVAPGEVCGLIGPNGSGKSTCFNLVSGLLRPDDGHVRFEGEDITRTAPHEIARRGVGRTFQIVRPLANLTCVDNLLPGLLYGADSRTLGQASAAAVGFLDLVGLEVKAQTLAGDLSLWEKKALEVARALAVGSRLLLLDEVFAGLSPAGVDRMVTVIEQLRRELDVTIVLVEHVMRATMALAGRIVVLSFGRVLTVGTPAEVTRHPDVIEVYLGRGHRTTAQSGVPADGEGKPC